MKKMLIAVLAAAFLLVSVAGPSYGQAKNQVTGNLSLSGAWALYPMALKWVEEFQKIYPGIKIDVQAGGAGKGIADAIAGMVDVGMVSREINPAETAKGAFAVAVTKDAVVPTMSSKNPFLKQIQARGLKKEEFAGLWVTKTVTSWDALLGRTGKAEIHVFTRSDACGAAETWAAYMGKKQEDLGGVGVYGDPGLADAVRRDLLGVGFNNVNFAYDAKTLKPIEGIAIVPIDINGNGKADPEESFYADRDSLTKAIAGNIYPSPPARDLYFVTKGKPEKPALVAFMKWILTEGQKYVPETGYIVLSREKLDAGLEKIGAPVVK
jgi:phosphate transport system substrate-binding protein